MGRLTASVTIQNILEPGHELRCDGLIDTGAYCLTLPLAWKERLGPFPMMERVQLETADHRLVDGELCGPARIQIEGFRAIAGEVLFMDMQPTDGRYEPLVGYLTLEQAGIAVDLVGHRLLRVPHLDLKRAGRRAA
jgi:hypothetical protein